MQIHKGKYKERIVSLLLAGTALSLSRSPTQQLRIIRELKEEWIGITNRNISRTIASLYRSNLISYRDNKDGTTTVFLNEKGKKLALTYNLDSMTLSKQSRWDKKWRIIMFDIPEKYRLARDSLRYQLKRMEFFEYQKSVFITPYDCLKEIEYLCEFYHIKKYVRIILATSLDDELKLRQHFDLD